MKLLSLLKWIVTHPLNKQGTTAALYRFFAWQISSRMLDCEILLPFVEDSVLVTRKGMTGATGNWYCGLHEPFEMSLVLHLLRPSDLFIDVGANIGSYSVLAAQTGATVIAIEPIASTAKHLRKNITVNNLEHQIQVKNVGLGETEGELLFTAHHDTMNHVILEPADDKIVEMCTRVPVTTLDLLCEGKAPRIIKVDVEGFELAVMAGGMRTLSSPNLLAVILEINGSTDRYGIDREEILKRMKDLGYSTAAYDPFSRTLTAAPPPQVGNTVFIRDLMVASVIAGQSKKYKLVNCHL